MPSTREADAGRPDHAAAVFCIASPLQLLAAERIARDHEAEARRILVLYKPGLRRHVQPADWDVVMELPWPRFEPLPGPFGVHRRLLQNVERLAGAVGRCERLHLHSAVFDTEAINHFLQALRRSSGAREFRARLLPDGLISTRRYPLSTLKRMVQQLRRLRGLFSRSLRYTAFAGDRTGADAPFCDRIYVLAGLPHEYDARRVVRLPALFSRRSPAADERELQASAGRTALVIGQPLVGFGLMTEAGMQQTAAEIDAWLAAAGVRHVSYKPHPKDRRQELSRPGYVGIDPDEPLERWLAGRRFDFVVGVRSSALLFARQLYGDDAAVLAFGWSRLAFKSAGERATMAGALEAAGVVLIGEADAAPSGAIGHAQPA